MQNQFPNSILIIFSSNGAINFIFIFLFFKTQAIISLIVSSSHFIIIKYKRMLLEDNISTTLSAYYELKLPSEVLKRDHVAKQVFLTENNSIFAWIQHTKEFNNDLVHILPNNKCTWFSLPLRATPKQLNKRQFVILNHSDGSVDRLLFDSNEWKMTNVRRPQNILLSGYSSELLVFTETQTYCLSEKYMGNIQRVSYCQIENDTQKVKNDFFMECKNTKIRQLNDSSKVGWLWSNDNTFHILDLSKSDNAFRIVQLPKSAEIGPEGMQISEDLNITQIRQIFEDNYLIYCHQEKPLTIAQNQRRNQGIFGGQINQQVQTVNHVKFMIVDVMKEKTPNFIRRINLRGQNEKLFKYSQYGFKTFGQFVVCWGKQTNLIDTEKMTRLDRDGTVFLGLKKSNLMHDEKIGPQSFELDVKLHQGQQIFPEQREGGLNFGRMGSELLQLKDIDKKLIFKITWKVFLKDHYMQMLLHIDEDLDDDFIQDILGLL